METATAAKAHIEEIRTKKFSIGKKKPNPLTEDFHHAVTSLSSELYTKDIHFLLELIQNAEDNEYPVGVEPTLEFVLTNDDITGTGARATLLVFNNEVGFSKKNMESICSVGRSTKKGKRRLGFIGEKGIGFKSVFLVSALPHIYSNKYRVRFSEEPNRDCGIGYIVPEWVGGKPHLSSIHHIYGTNKVLPTTTIILPLKPEKVEAVKAQLSELHPELLLFLSKIKRLYVRGNGCDPSENENVSAISISSETDHVELREERADSRLVQLSVKEKMSATEETCRYYMWRQTFPVKPENRVSARMDVEEWVITLAFPFGNRLKRGTSSAGIFSFLPTAMDTNFPFVIQADFILASSRETILLDNKWNLGILDCVPSVFRDAFNYCVKKDSPLSSVAAFEFLPAQASPIPKLNEMRESIRAKLRILNIVPCESFSGKEVFCWPHYAIRILPEFRKLLSQMKCEGVPLGHLASLNRYVLHSSLDLERYNAILDFLGVVSVGNCCTYDWYAKCIRTCSFALLASEDVYMTLLCFIADNKRDSLMNIPFLKYVDRDGSLRVCPLSKVTREQYKVQYAVKPELHSWLNKCNLEFGCPNNIFMLPNSTQNALLSHCRSSFLQNWLSSDAGVTSCSACMYGHQLNSIVSDKTDFAVHLAHFLYYSHRKKLMDDFSVSDLCRNIPLIDGSGHVRIGRTVTLVSASGSKWVTLFGPSNPFVEHKYIALGDVYAKRGKFAGECTPEKKLLIFLSKHTRAVDIPKLNPPNVALEVAYSELTCEQAFLLLDWIQWIRANNSHGPEKFIKSIQDGKWLKTFSGFNSPNRSIFLDATGKIIFDMMKNFLEGFSTVDQEFYMNRINLYSDVLKFLGVSVGLDDLLRLVVVRSKLSASSGMSKECALSLLMFIGYLKASNMLDEDWLEALGDGKWLRTSQGFTTPRGSVLLQSEREAEAVLKITNIPVVDEGFYGSKIASFSSELMLLGVVLNLEEGYKLIAENLTFPTNLSSLTGNSGLLILKCIRYMGSASSGLVEKIRNQPWLKTSYGIKCPPESILPDPLWSCLLNGFQLPIIDEAFYGDVIRSFVAELEAVGVAVDFSSALKMIVSQFKSHTSSSLTPANIISLLDGFRETSQTVSSQITELCKCLSEEEWLKTRHGYRSPCESILFSSKWGTISLFVDLPLVDDCFYGIGIYGYKDELKMLGVMTKFMEGAPFVAKGLNRPIDPTLLTAEGSISLLECIKFIMSDSHEPSLLADFITNLKSSKWLKTKNGYRKPEECILFDPAWEGILDRTDAPTIDENFYETDITVYKDQLRGTGVKVDSGDVCSFLSGLLLVTTDTMSITRIYGFLNNFNWKPETIDKSNSRVWIPCEDVGGGEWVKSQLCVLHDKNNLFGSHFYSLDKFYMKKLLPFFSKAFGVAEFPSIDDYLQLWNSWVSRDKHQVTVAECYAFWEYVLDNWNPQTQEILKQNLTRIPGTFSDEEIYLLRKEEVFIADDLLLKKVFSSANSIPLFVWFPKRSSSSSVSPVRLCKIYGSLGIRKISEIVECDLSCASLYGSKKIDPRNDLIGKGLIKIILSFLAGSESHMTVEERHKAAKSMLNLTVYKSEKPIEVSYRLMPSADVTLEVKIKKMVLWKKDSQQLLIDNSGYEDWKSNIEFVSCFAQEIAEGLLTRERADAVNSLTKIIQMGFVFEFKDDAVDFLLAKENLELFTEDEDFLGATFPSSGLSAIVPRKRTYRKLDQLVGSSTPKDQCKKLCQE